MTIAEESIALLRRLAALNLFTGSPGLGGVLKDVREFLARMDGADVD